MLKDHICAVPFKSLEIHDKKRFLCCASWLKQYLPDSSSPYGAWYSEEAKNVRESILDGSYRHCDGKQCPFLNSLINNGKTTVSSPIYHKDNLPAGLAKAIDQFKNGATPGPDTVQFSFDRSCNLNCPSCRLKVIMASNDKIKQSKATIEEIRETFGHSLKGLYITGSGDPFVAVAFRDFLREFDKSQWPNLEFIHLHTNATMWTPKMWASMKNIHPYVRSCEISIDAGTKHTYENETRLRGDWDQLMSNLKFISTIPTLKSVKPSFVVQHKNYKEMHVFYKLMNTIFKSTPSLSVYYNRITNWGTFSDSEFVQADVLNSEHQEYNDAVDIINSFLPADKVFHNLHNFIKEKSALI